MKKLFFVFIFLSSVMFFISCSEEEHPESIPPNCLITSPTNNAEFTQGEIITINVEAEDKDGYIDEVRFYIDDIGVGSVNNFPYTYKWDTKDYEIAEHRIKVGAYDNDGNIAYYTKDINLIAPPTSAFNGYVKNSLGEGIKGAIITIQQNTTKSAEFTNNASTAFSIPYPTNSFRSQIKQPFNLKFKKPSNKLIDWMFNPESKPTPKPQKLIDVTLPLKSTSSIITDENGYFENPDIEYGNFTIFITHDEYIDFEQNFEFTEQNTQQQFDLTAKELKDVSTISLTDRSFALKSSWTAINTTTLQGYNNYESHFLWYNSDLSEDEDYFYPVYTSWDKTNSSVIEDTETEFDAEEYNGKYGAMVLPVNIDDFETNESNSTETDYIELSKKAQSLANFSLTEQTDAIYIPDNSHKIALHMRFYYTDANQILQMDNWKVRASENGSSWTTIATHYLPTGNIPATNYGYTKTIAMNAYKGKTIYLKTEPESFPEPGSAFTIENLIMEYSQDGSGFETGEAPIANFSASPTSTEPDETITFNDLSTNTPTTWLWDFGDGNTSNLQNPTHAFSDVGTYTISLEVTNNYGSDSETKTNYINIDVAGSAPVAAFTADKTTITEGENINFTDQSQNTPTSWSWSFGDGNTSIEQNPSHIYTATGTYTVSLTCTNSIDSDTETKTNYISVGLIPQSDFTINIDIVIINENIHFSDESVNYPTTWLWEFGDGFTSYEQNPLHSYSQPGTYTVSLTSTNIFGEHTSSKTNIVTVLNSDGSGSVSDIEGNSYKIVTIGEQLWMAENLNCSKYRNGNLIPHISDNNQWIALEDNNTSDAYCYYDNNNSISYGKLYSYGAAEDVCPVGWHLPANDDWTTLITYIENDGYQGVVGNALRSTAVWEPAGFGKDIYGFNGLPGGIRRDFGEFGGLGTYAIWWSKNVQSYNYYSRTYYLDDNNNSLNNTVKDKGEGCSVRCIKD